MSEISTFVETWDTLLKHFCSRDDLRPALCKPNIVGDYVYATDAHSWVKVPFQPSFRGYGTHPKTPNFAAVSDSWQFLEKPVTIFKKSFLDALLKFEKIPDWIECKDCKGTGTKECQCCGTELECRNCNGEGGVDDYTVPEVYESNEARRSCIKIMENLVSPFQLGRLVRLMDFLNLDSILLFTNLREKGLVFRSGDIEIVVMPLMGSAEDEIIVKLEI